ncbi:MAG TPA: haloacid dehalogenase type II [Xanthobacteraceae bacterium]|nr:haloacid dehalogenase type II [Xanthobacteraceae bacterium]
MIRAFVFDAYGTLFDVHAAIARQRTRIGPDADRLSELWRTKQLEYAWNLTLRDRYDDFWTLTKRALDFALSRFPHVDRRIKASLLEAYRELDAFPDARNALAALKEKGHTTAILSNGSPAMLNAAVAAAGLGALLDHVISVDGIRTYKPRRAVYELAIGALGVRAGDIAFVSSNRWDVAGAADAGLAAIWINRGRAADEYAEGRPRAVIFDLAGLAELRL